MRYLVSFICLFTLLLTSASAQGCYDRFLQEGIEAYEALDFETAMKKFEAAKICDDRPEGQEPEEWLQKASNGRLNALQVKQKELEAALNESERRLAELTAANEKIVASLVKTFHEQIYRLEYDQAWETAKQWTVFGMRKEELKKAFAELVWFNAEAGMNSLAMEILTSAAPVIEGAFPSVGNRDPVAFFKQALSLLADAASLEEIHYRYYPHMVRVEGGTFWMGEGEGKHQVTVSDFEIASTELTVHQWYLYSVSSGYPMPDPSGWGWNGDNPMINISWYDCVSYSNWLNQRKGDEVSYTLHSYDPANGFADSASWKGLKHPGFRLPTEAEWEYAAGGGNKGRDADGNLRQKYAGSYDPDSVAWYYDNSRARTQPVAWLNPNARGLYDMSGNVWELCWDWYGFEYSDEPQTNPTGPIYGVYRVSRGGSWGNDAGRCSVVDRDSWGPRDRYRYIGFRPSRTVNF